MTNTITCITTLQQNYLMNFGYLPKTDIETGNLRSESQLIDAIKTLQVRPSPHLWAPLTC